MDWRVYHAINVWVSHHEWVGRVFRYVESDGTALIAVAAVALWLAARPGADRKWKLVAASTNKADSFISRRRVAAMNLLGASTCT